MGDVGEVGGFVGFASVGIGCEVGAVGLEHEAVNALGAERFPHGLGTFIGEDAGEGGAASALVDAEDFFGAVAEAVKDNVVPVDAGLVDQTEGVCKGIAAMDDDGKIEFPGEGELLGKGGFLLEDDLPGFDRVFRQVKIVEPDLAEGDGGMGGHEEGADLADRNGPLGIDIAGMEPDGVMDAAGVGGRHFAVGHPVFRGGANSNQLMDTGRFGPLEDGGEATVFPVAEEVAMTVDEFHVIRHRF